jgi:hypothetical protein
MFLFHHHSRPKDPGGGSQAIAEGRPKRGLVQADVDAADRLAVKRQRHLPDQGIDRDLPGHTLSDEDNAEEEDEKEGEAEEEHEEEERTPEERTSQAPVWETLDSVANADMYEAMRRRYPSATTLFCPFFACSGKRIHGTNSANTKRLLLKHFLEDHTTELANIEKALFLVFLVAALSRVSIVNPSSDPMPEIAKVGLLFFFSISCIHLSSTLSAADEFQILLDRSLSFQVFSNPRCSHRQSFLRLCKISDEDLRRTGDHDLGCRFLKHLLENAKRVVKTSRSFMSDILHLPVNRQLHQSPTSGSARRPQAVSADANLISHDRPANSDAFRPLYAPLIPHDGHSKAHATASGQAGNHQTVAPATPPTEPRGQHVQSTANSSGSSPTPPAVALSAQFLVSNTVRWFQLPKSKIPCSCIPPFDVVSRIHQSIAEEIDENLEKMQAEELERRTAGVEVMAKRDILSQVLRLFGMKPDPARVEVRLSSFFLFR